MSSSVLPSFLAPADSSVINHVGGLKRLQIAAFAREITAIPSLIFHFILSIYFFSSIILVFLAAKRDEDWSPAKMIESSIE